MIHSSVPFVYRLLLYDWQKLRIYYQQAYLRILNHPNNPNIELVARCIDSRTGSQDNLA